MKAADQNSAGTRYSSGKAIAIASLHCAFLRTCPSAEMITCIRDCERKLTGADAAQPSEVQRTPS
jgi:hypothetical protein